MEWHLDFSAYKTYRIVLEDNVSGHKKKQKKETQKIKFFINAFWKLTAVNFFKDKSKNDTAHRLKPRGQFWFSSI